MFCKNLYDLISSLHLITQCLNSLKDMILLQTQVIMFLKTTHIQ